MRGSNSPINREIVLLGGGHAHLQVLRRFLMDPVAGARVTLVSRDGHAPYTGMLPGYLAGHYTFDESHIDLRRYCQRTATRFVQCTASDIDLENRSVIVADRAPIPFDLLSVNIGSRPNQAGVHIDTDSAWPVKPVDNLLRAWRRVESTVERASRPFNVVIVGAGAGGLEVALALRHRHRRMKHVAISVINDNETILPGHTALVRSKMTRALSEHGITLHTGAAVTRIDDAAVHFDDREPMPCDFAVLATQAHAHDWLRGTGLRLDDDGFICITQTLQCVDHEFVFAAGDAASFAPRRLIKNGVHAVRQGPVLADNLRRYSEGGVLRRYSPQRLTLAILSTGERHGVASYGHLAVSGDWVWQFKNWLDRRWMRKFEHLPEMAVDENEPMRCGGCGAKVPAEVLSDALGKLTRAHHPRVRHGLEAPDDAAVVAPEPDRLLVQSVDQFRSFIDDPYVFGRIAATHALSDIYAMGARPDTAMAIVTLPYAGTGTMRGEMSQLMAGAERTLGESQTVLIGGHSGEGTELMFGLSINGSVAEGELLLKSGLRADQCLILTKPLGTGTVLAAHMRGEADGEHVASAIDCMLQRQAEALALLQEHGTSACTDVTGFGLLGHLGEMLRASDTHARLLLDRIPVLQGALAYITRGLLSTLHPANKSTGVALTGAPIDTPVHEILCDPQTSGGLLASVPRDSAEDCVAALRRAGYHGAACIGDVCAGPPGRITLQRA